MRYDLTSRGLDLLPVLLEPMAWSTKHEKTGASANFARRLRTDRAGLEREIRQRFPHV